LQVGASSYNSNKSNNQMQQSQVYYLTFMYSSTYFGRPHAHHQELNNCSSSSNGKTRGCYCSCWAPDYGREDARNVLSCT